MNNIFLRKLTAAMMVSAGLLAIDLGPLYAQSQSQQGNTSQSQSQSSQGTKQNKNQSGAHSGNHSASMGKASAGSMFVKKAAESNMAEIELSRLALQNASSQQVKEYAQQMIDHHTMAQQELATIVSGSASMNSGQSGNDANMDDSNTGSGNTSATPNVSGGTTGAGTTYSSGNASGAEGTQGNVTGQGSSANRQGNSSGSNDPNASNKAAGTTGGSKSGIGAGSNYESSSTGGGGAGANAGGTTSSTGLGTGGGTGTSGATRGSDVTNSNTEINNNAGTSTNDSGSGTAGNSANSAGNTASSSNSGASSGMNQSSAMYGDLPTQLSAEHQALHDKLSKLNGAEFDRQYIQAMVKDHAKAVELFEKQSKSDSDAALQGYATKNLPLIKQHYQMAQKLSASGSKNSSSKGTSDSK